MATVSQQSALAFDAFPPGTVTDYTTLFCLACIFELFTAQLGLAPRTAYSEIKRHTPTLPELTAAEPARPYFQSTEKHPRCPYCDSTKRWHARLDTYRIEGGKATDAPRRALIKGLPKADAQFQLLEIKTDRRALLFEWLDRLGRSLDFGTDEWLLAVARAYLERREPKTDWPEIFEGLRAVRRSHRLEEGWERDGARLFLAPPLYNDVLLVQYLVSRSQHHGGSTFEGRLTFPQLVRRMRAGGSVQIEDAGDRLDVPERLVESLAGGEGTVKLYYIVDRRDFLAKVKTVYARYAA
ncbi:MAG TPA: hypothetical protein VF723_12610 [Pyrinomonadaceae bacterium]|jgi:hypothetical protein